MRLQTKFCRADLVSLLAIFLATATTFGKDAQSVKSGRLDSFRHIGFDLRGSRNGNGDVAASYLTALEFIERDGYSREILFVADDAALKILSRMTGQSISSGSRIQNQIVVKSIEHMTSDSPPLDLFLQLAQKDSYLHNGDRQQIAFSNTNEEPKPGTIPLQNDAVQIRQTVFASTEYQQNSVIPGRDPKHFGSIGVGQDRYFNVPPPGVSSAEIGIYYDGVARNVARLDTQARKNFVIQEALKSQQSRVAEIVGGSRLQGSKFALAYGLWDASQQTQFRTYLEGLAKNQTTESYVFISPLELDVTKFPAELAKRVVVLASDQAAPTIAKPGTIYFQKTSFLSHRLFTGLIGASQIPPVIAGDNALSAALQIGRPFVMTRVPWNAANVENLGNIVTANQNAKNTAVLAAIFPTTTQPMSLENALTLDEPRIAAKFLAARTSFKYQSDTLLLEAKNAKEIVTTARQSKTADELYGRIRHFMRNGASAETRQAALTTFLRATYDAKVRALDYPEVSVALRSRDPRILDSLGFLNDTPKPNSRHFWEECIGVFLSHQEVDSTVAVMMRQKEWPGGFVNQFKKLIFNENHYVANSAANTLIAKGAPESTDLLRTLFGAVVSGARASQTGEFGGVLRVDSAGKFETTIVENSMLKMVQDPAEAKKFSRILEEYFRSGDPRKIAAADQISRKVLDGPWEYEKKGWPEVLKTNSGEIQKRFGATIAKVPGRGCAKDFAAFAQP